MTIFLRAVELYGIALCQGNGSRGLICEFGERALISSCSIICLACEGPLVTLPVIGSRMNERFVCAVCCRCFFVVRCGFLDGFAGILCFSYEIWRSTARSSQDYLA